jgi:hypothetical protein
VGKSFKDNDFLLPTEEQGDERKELAHRSSELLWKQLSPYLATPAHLRLWNYPQLITTEETEKNESEKNKKMKVEELIKEESLEETGVVLMKEEEQQQEKEGEQGGEQEKEETLVNKEMGEDVSNAGLIPPSVPEQAVPPVESAVESLTQVGLDLLPSLEEIEQLKQESAFSFRYVEFFKDFPKNQDLFHSSHFLQSVDYPSSFYEALWSPDDQPRRRRGTQQPLMIATIDCEMCDTIHGLEVTRVTVLNQNQETIIDLLIKPDSPILDYRTQFSGMTALLLNPIKTTLLQVQLLLARLIVNKTIVIGHSLENDLKGLKFFHERIIDTTMLFPHPQGFPYRNKLKYLAKEYLQLMIQQQHPSGGQQKNNNKKKNSNNNSVVPSGGAGHDSREDAAATLQLVLLKMSKGPSFGIPASEGIRVPLTKRLSYLTVPSLLIDYQPIETGLEKKDKPNSNGESHFLESLICQGCRIIKKNNTEEIIEEIESFVKENQAHQKKKNQKDESSSSKKRSFGELEGKDGSEENDMNRSDCDKPHFIHLSIPFRSMPSSSSSSSSTDNDLTKTDNKDIILSFIKQLKERLSPSLPDNNDNIVISTHGLLLVTSQKSLHAVEEMISKKEKVFSNQRKMSSTIWSSKDEEILKNVIKETSLGEVAFKIL